MRQELIWRGVEVIEKMERETGFEPAKSSLVSCRRLLIGHLPNSPRTGGGNRGTPWVSRRLPTCPTHDSSLHASLPGRADHGLERGLGLALAIEQQRIAGPAADRPVIQPRVAIGNAPESDTRDGTAVLAEHREEIGIPASQRLLHRVRQPTGVRIEFGVSLRSE